MTDVTLPSDYGHNPCVSTRVKCTYARYIAFAPARHSCMVSQLGHGFAAVVNRENPLSRILLAGTCSDLLLKEDLNEQV